jgi:nucleotide-binding universal stress UspA family protein
MTEQIIVGIEDTPGSVDALAWALVEAALRGATVEAIHVWLKDATFDEPAARSMLDRIVGEAQARTGSTVEPTRTVLNGVTPRHALVEASETADLLVVGVRGHGSAVDRMLGSVSTACVHHARCPVLVVRPAAHHLAARPDVVDAAS